VALLACWFAIRITNAAAEAIGLLYVLPEATVQLLDDGREHRILRSAA
jgi:hypothetical protein